MRQGAGRQAWYGGLEPRVYSKQRDLNAADGQRLALKPLGPFAGRARVGYGGGLPVQAGGPVSRCGKRFRMVQDTGSAHPGTNQHQQPGGHAA